jgi:mono/diheme cytochrome c family protein
MRRLSGVLCLLAGAGFVCSGCDRAPGATEAAPMDVAAAASAASFDGGIGQILAERCGNCHIEDQKGDFSMADLHTALAGGKSGAVVLPRDSEHSLLYRMISGAPGVKQMPPRGEPLTAEQVAQIKAWIDAGAQ